MNALHFGCGTNILLGYINCDIQKGPGIDYSFDFDVFPYPFSDNTFDLVFHENVLEHLDRPTRVTAELWRICKPNAVIHFKVPMWNHTFAYNDPEHRHYFNERSIEVLCNINSTYSHAKQKFKIISIKKVTLGWRRHLPYFIRQLADKFLTNTFCQLDCMIKVIK